MTTQALLTTTDDLPAPGAALSVDRMPAHWLMARLGKRVLRPGGVEATHWLIERGRLGEGDDVVELAPGLGHTARSILGTGPRSYVGVERDATAVAATERALATSGDADARVVHADASNTGLASASATAVMAEALLSMQPARRKQAIMAEVARVLRPGGRYLVHELAVAPDAIDPAHHRAIERELSLAIKVGVRVGTTADWRTWLEAEGFALEASHTLPMRLLEPDRLIADEGLPGALRIAWNALRTPGAPARLRALRSSFRAHRDHLCAIAMVARRQAQA